MDEGDVTLYINCRNKFSVKAMWKFIRNLLEIMNVKYKANSIYYILEIRPEEDYIFYVRFIDTENCIKSFLKEKYYLSNQEILDYIKNNKTDEDVYKNIFGNFVKGLN